MYRLPEITQVLESHRDERHVAILQDFPDPNAISSAFAHQVLSARFGIEVDMVYAGQISHQQNVALVKLLGIDLVRYTEDLGLSQYDGAVFVDTQGTTATKIAQALTAGGVPPLMVVDHHETQGELEPEFEDIRRIGATATIYAEYLEHGPLEMDRARPEHVLVATALMHGIITDTMGSIRARPEDFRAAAFLSRFRDADLLEQVMTQMRSKQTMEIIRLALGNRVAVENFSIAGIGYLRREDRDAIPQAADFLLTEENVHTAIAYGIVSGDGRGEALVGSMRTSELTLDPDEFIKDVLGTDAIGRYFGGGRVSAGGFEIPIGFLSGGEGEPYQDRKWHVYDAQIKTKIFAKIGVESGTGSR